ncbi:MAG: VOC family protein [Thermoplasmata archaeon]|nr:VOC family protein [Thermoplasmata archaeon]
MAIIQDIGHLILPVNDMDDALAFYRDLLGFHLVGKASPVWTVIETKGGQVTLWRSKELAKVAYGPKGEDTPFEFHVGDFEKAAAVLVSHGKRVKRVSAHGGIFWDPFGNALRVHDHREEPAQSSRPAKP